MFLFDERKTAMQHRLLPILIPLSIMLAAGMHLTSCGPKAVVVDTQKNPITEAKVNLGRMLYFEPRLSKNQAVSCNSCHALANDGEDGQPVSAGQNAQKATRNATTVYNAADHFVLFWDGRAPDVEEQAKGPIMNPVEMTMSSYKAVIAVLKSMPEYVDAFKKAFPDDKDPVTFENMAEAIGVFERRLMTPSRWDKFLNGDQAALSNAEKAGFNKFMEVGCQACHAGTYLGDEVYQKLAAVKPDPNTSDAGRQALTEQESDGSIFKVPSLRNIDKPGPNLHTGKIMVTLEEVVREMADHQLGKQLTDGEIASLVAFLKTLTGEIPTEYLKPPELPKSTGKTPKPSST
jgi:cytochrome c peroxidase